MKISDLNDKIAIIDSEKEDEKLMKMKFSKQSEEL